MHMNIKFAIRLTISIALLLALTKVSIATYVLEQTRIIQKRDVTNAPTFVDKDGWDKLFCGDFSLLTFGYNYFKMFGPLSEEDNDKTFLYMLFKTYKKGLLENNSTLERVLKASLNINNYDIAAFNLSKKSADVGLEAAVLYVYTTKYIYRKLNEALRLETTFMKRRETSMGAFALVLNAILFYWVLQSTQALTYRRMNLYDSDLAMYRKGTIFVWIDFTSSSLNESVTTKYGGNVLFIFNNTEYSAWSPKLIYNFSYNPADLEALYPSGATFEVTSVDNQDPNLTKIKAQLMADCFTIRMPCHLHRKRDTGDTCPWQPVGTTPSSSHTASQGISLPKIPYVACIFVYFILGSLFSVNIRSF